MKIQLKEVLISDVFEGYQNKNEEGGVIGYGGKLNIRPKYQREFIYKDKQRDAVVETVKKNFPLNVMYWVKNLDGTFEVLDGQQRTISICEYINGSYSLDFQYFHNLTPGEQDQILNYTLMVYFCEGTDREKLDWFKTINIASEKLTNQELRNAIYTGPWLSDAKKYFSKTGGPAYNIAHRYMKGTPIRQDYLETAIDWISNSKIEWYMATHQNDKNANKLWLHFKSVISWVETLFANYRKEMKGVPFGELYDDYKNESFDSDDLETEIVTLMQDDDVTNKKGIYQYVLTRNEKHLSVRAFTYSQKRGAYERQKGICIKCSDQFGIEEMDADHITPWSKGGKTTVENCQMLCKPCNRTKSNK